MLEKARLKAFVKLLYNSKPASFPSPYTPELAAQRLSPLVQRTALNIWFQGGLVGKVTSARVSIFRHRPVLRNSFKPIFTGTFTQRNGVTVLEGHFSMHWFARVFMSCWFGGLAIGAFAIIGASIAQDQPLLLIFLTGIFIIGAGGAAIVYLGWLLSSNDVAYISESIRRGIGSENAG